MNKHIFFMISQDRKTKIHYKAFSHAYAFSLNIKEVKREMLQFGGRKEAGLEPWVVEVF